MLRRRTCRFRSPPGRPCSKTWCLSRSPRRSPARFASRAASRGQILPCVRFSTAAPTPSRPRPPPTPPRLRRACTDGVQKGLLRTYRSFVVPDGVDINNLAYSVLRSTAQITGSLKDGGGNAIAGVNVYAYTTVNGTDFNTIGDNLTDVSGNFALKVANGSWTVSVDSSGLSQKGFSQVDSKTVVIARANQSVNFVAIDPSAHLRGRLLDNTAAAVTFMNIFGFPNTGGFAQSTTDASGSFDLGVNGGQWTLQLNTDPNSGAPSRGLVSPSLSLTVVDGVNQSNIVVIAQKSTAQI